MRTILILTILGIMFSGGSKAQTTSSLLVGDFNKVGDFVALHPHKIFDLDPEKDSPKFAKLRFSTKEMVLTYKVTGPGKGAIRYFDPQKTEWVDIFTIDCCTQASKASLWIFDGKGFKQKSDVLFFYTEVFYDSARTLVKEKHLQIIKFMIDASFRKYDLKLNAKNKFPHKVIVSKWLLREQFGEFEDKYKEYSLEEKVVTSY